MLHEELSRLLQQGDFDALFRRQMGWDNPEHRVPVEVDDSVLRPVPVADKRGITAWLVDCPNGLPKRSEQHRVVRRLKRLSRDQLVVFVAPDKHLWQWPEQRPSGVGYRLVDHEYPVDTPTDALLQRLSQATFKIEEEGKLTSSSVLDRVRRSFNADKVTKSFYREFQKHHKNFALSVEGIPTDMDRRWYASVLMNRLMFIYFIQQKRFLDDDPSYLRSRLAMVRASYGPEQFYAFYKRFLLPLFHEGLGSPAPEFADDETRSIIGVVPYVNGGIFEQHRLEATHEIEIPDDAFEALFDFFDEWRWHLDERPSADGKEINPDVLGYIFEQYINFNEAGQKEKGAYYTKPDVTGYMAESSILPAVADRLVAAGLEDPAVLLGGSGDAFIRDSLGHGISHPDPEPKQAKTPAAARTASGADWTAQPDPEPKQATTPSQAIQRDTGTQPYPPERATNPDISTSSTRAATAGGTAAVWPWERRSGDPADYVELEPPGEELALPGERWCDVVHRRDRYKRQVEMLSDTSREWSIDDAITENLALPELLRAYMSQLSDADECQRAFEVLRSLTVCDPTVGSGAFLFAAIDVLEPLYSEVLARAGELDSEGRPVPGFLHEARGHRNPGYWLVKTICLRNLFGVDLMQEAPEIAKLRLFLKLAAQIDRVEDLEPLPDLDFNIKCGNLLVGIADENDFLDRLGGSGNLDAGYRFDDIKELSHELGAAYEEFVTDQSEPADADSADRKQRLSQRFDEARERCHALLYEVREPTGTDRDRWVEAHQPFHWFVEFPSVWQNGGFDVVIGNPPYIKKSLVTDYTWRGYKTEKCPDLYALCMERATTLVNDKGRFAMIVMHSLCFSRGFLSLRKQLERSFGSLWVSSYSRSPGGLFSDSAGVRNSILLAGKERAPGTVRTTLCMRWLAEARTQLFASFEYTDTGLDLLHRGPTRQWPFANDTSSIQALRKMVRDQRPLASSLLLKGGFELGYKTTALFQLGVFVQEPPTVNPDTGDPALTKSVRSGWLHFGSELEMDLALVMLTGRWGYLWWLTYSDQFDVTRTTLGAFPGDIERLATHAPGDMELKSLVGLSRTLQGEMPRNLAWKNHAGVKVGRYNMLKLRHITDRADWLLAKAWGLDTEAFEAAGNLRDRMIFGNKE